MKWTRPSSRTNLTQAQWVLLRAQPTLIIRKKGGAFRHITTLGIDVAKSVFQLHGVDARGRVVLSRCVKRAVGTESGESAALCDRDGDMRECAALGAGD